MNFHRICFGGTGAGKHHVKLKNIIHLAAKTMAGVIKPALKSRGSSNKSSNI
jgi:hypothetical protein